MTRNISPYPSNYRAILIRELHDVEPLVRLGSTGLVLGHVAHVVSRDITMRPSVWRR